MQTATLILFSLGIIFLSNGIHRSDNDEHPEMQNSSLLTQNGIKSNNHYSEHPGIIRLATPSKNLFGQPIVTAQCRVTEMVWVGSDTKSIFTYNKDKQLVRHVETDGGMTVNVEYNSNGQISRVIGFDPADEMQLKYDEKGILKTLEAKKVGGTEVVAFTYNGDKIVKATYQSFSITYYFDEDYNLAKAITEEQGGKVQVEEIIEVNTRYKNYLLGTGDYRFLSLLYGDYSGEGAHGNAGINHYKKFTYHDKTVEASKKDSFETEVETANVNGYPAVVSYKFLDPADNVKTNIIYECN